MKRGLAWLFVSLFSIHANALSWRDLWLTPDQQGQSLMKNAQFAKAKETFERHDWTAVAAYKSGDYQKAAELFKEIKTEQGYYNAGNALARLGQFEQAISSYDKTLALNPKNQDAIYNRQLVKDLMKKDKEKKQDQQGKDQKDKDQQNKDQKDKDQQSKDQKDKDQQSKDQKDKDQQSKDQKDKDQQSKDQKDKDQQNKDQQDKDQRSKDQKNQKDDKKQASEQQSEANKEKQQAKEQWLKLIPDDPGGLMREKFLRDHLRRERGWYQ